MTTKTDILQFQDKNNNGINDACPDDAAIQPANNCPSCKPNPNFALPNWKKKKLNCKGLVEKRIWNNID